MNEENIYYIIEVCVGGEKLYMYSKRIAVHFPDISKKYHKNFETFFELREAVMKPPADIIRIRNLLNVITVYLSMTKKRMK